MLHIFEVVLFYLKNKHLIFEETLLVCSGKKVIFFITTFVLRNMIAKQDFNFFKAKDNTENDR